MKGSVCGLVGQVDLTHTNAHHRLYVHVNGLAMLYNIFRHPLYGHVIKLRVCSARRSPPAI